MERDDEMLGSPLLGEGSGKKKERLADTGWWNHEEAVQAMVTCGPDEVAEVLRECVQRRPACVGVLLTGLLLGYSVDVEFLVMRAMECIAMPGAGLKQKRAGYALCCLAMSKDDERVPLLGAQLLKDLTHECKTHVLVALTFLPHLVSELTFPLLITPVWKLTSCSSPFVRKHALTTIHALLSSSHLRKHALSFAFLTPHDAFLSVMSSSAQSSPRRRSGEDTAPQPDPTNAAKLAEFAVCTTLVGLGHRKLCSVSEKPQDVTALLAATLNQGRDLLRIPRKSRRNGGGARGPITEPSSFLLIGYTRLLAAVCARCTPSLLAQELGDVCRVYVAVLSYAWMQTSCSKDGDVPPESPDAQTDPASDDLSPRALFSTAGRGEQKARANAARAYFESHVEKMVPPDAAKPVEERSVAAAHSSSVSVTKPAAAEDGLTARFTQPQSPSTESPMTLAGKLTSFKDAARDLLATPNRKASDGVADTGGLGEPSAYAALGDGDTKKRQESSSSVGSRFASFTKELLSSGALPAKQNSWTKLAAGDTADGETDGSRLLSEYAEFNEAQPRAQATPTVGSKLSSFAKDLVDTARGSGRSGEDNAAAGAGAGGKLSAIKEAAQDISGSVKASYEARKNKVVEAISPYLGGDRSADSYSALGDKQAGGTYEAVAPLLAPFFDKEKDFFGGAEFRDVLEPREARECDAAAVECRGDFTWFAVVYEVCRAVLRSCDSACGEDERDGPPSAFISVCARFIKEPGAKQQRKSFSQVKKLLKAVGCEGGESVLAKVTAVFGKLSQQEGAAEGAAQRERADALYMLLRFVSLEEAMRQASEEGRSPDGASPPSSAVHRRLIVKSLYSGDASVFLSGVDAMCNMTTEHNVRKVVKLLARYVRCPPLSFANFAERDALRSAVLQRLLRLMHRVTRLSAPCEYLKVNLALLREHNDLLRPRSSAQQAFADWLQTTLRSVSEPDLRNQFVRIAAGSLALTLRCVPEATSPPRPREQACTQSDVELVSSKRVWGGSGETGEAKHEKPAKPVVWGAAPPEEPSPPSAEVLKTTPAVWGPRGPAEEEQEKPVLHVRQGQEVWRAPGGPEPGSRTLVSQVAKLSPSSAPVRRTTPKAGVSLALTSRLDWMGLPPDAGSGVFVPASAVIAKWGAECGDVCTIEEHLLLVLDTIVEATLTLRTHDRVSLTWCAVKLYLSLSSENRGSLSPLANSSLRSLLCDATSARDTAVAAVAGEGLRLIELAGGPCGNVFDPETSSDGVQVDPQLRFLDTFVRDTAAERRSLGLCVKEYVSPQQRLALEKETERTTLLGELHDAACAADSSNTPTLHVVDCLWSTAGYAPFLQEGVDSDKSPLVEETAKQPVSHRRKRKKHHWLNAVLKDPVEEAQHTGPAEAGPYLRPAGVRTWG